MCPIFNSVGVPKKVGTFEHEIQARVDIQIKLLSNCIRFASLPFRQTMAP